MEVPYIFYQTYMQLSVFTFHFLLLSLRAGGVSSAALARRWGGSFRLILLLGSSPVSLRCELSVSVSLCSS